MFTWLADVIDEQGPDMVEKFGKVFQFGILDETDTEVPITIDFKNGKGDIFLGNPRVDSEGKQNVACKVKVTEKDFHKILEGDLGVKKALLTGKIRIEGGVSGMNSAQALVNDFLNPYLIDTWAESQRIEVLKPGAKPSVPGFGFSEFSFEDQFDKSISPSTGTLGINDS